MKGRAGNRSDGVVECEVNVCRGNSSWPGQQIDPFNPVPLHTIQVGDGRASETHR